MKNLTWQNPEQLFVAQELINKVKSKCCGIKVNKFDAYKEGEYFVISNADMVMETKEIDELITVNQMVEIAINNGWVLSYSYKQK